MGTNPFLRATQRIHQDADKVFGALMEHVLEQYLAPDKPRDLAEVKTRIANHVATVLEHKQILLLDTLLNHLTKDAIDSLAAADTPTKNRFHAYNRTWIERVKAGRDMTAPDRVRFSSDRRLAYSAGAGLLAGGGVRWFVAGTAAASLQAPLVLGSIAAAAFLTFQTASHRGFRAIEREVEKYLNTCKAATLVALDGTIDRYRADFIDFVSGEGQASPSRQN